jgi:hypothetical protein
VGGIVVNVIWTFGDGGFVLGATAEGATGLAGPAGGAVLADGAGGVASAPLP